MSVVGHPDGEQRQAPHSRTIKSGNDAFTAFSVPGLPAPVGDARSIAVYANAGSAILTITGTFTRSDDPLGPASQTVAVSDGLTPLTLLRSGGHILTALTIDDGGAGASGAWAVTASNLDPLPARQGAPAGVLYHGGIGPGETYPNGALTQATFAHFETDSPGIFVGDLVANTINTTLPGLCLCSFGIIISATPPANDATVDLQINAGGGSIIPAYGPHAARSRDGTHFDVWNLMQLSYHDPTNAISASVNNRTGADFTVIQQALMVVLLSTVPAAIFDSWPAGAPRF